MRRPRGILVSCGALVPIARRFWTEVKKVEGVTIPNFHPTTWAADVLKPEVCNSKTAALVVCGAWTLWSGRNAKRAAVRFISNMLEELASLKVPKVPKLVRTPEKWRCPEEGWVKVNSDAGFDAAEFSSSSGVVIRDHRGAVKAAAARWFDDVPDVLTAEAMAAKEGLELAVENGYDKVILEVDYCSLMVLLNGDEATRSSIGGLCFDITELGRSFVDF